MQIKEYLKKYQSINYQTFKNALSTGRLSHAYLLSGSSGMPLKESALFFAKSLICDNPTDLACNSCITCLRVDEGNYPDVIVIDGAENKIKKGDVERIMNNFDKTALESKGVMIYILHLIETMTPIAVNSLLKFLEEPGKNIYAFLTTENESKILPTILSRTQILRFRSTPKQDIINDALEAGVSQEDAEMLCAFYNDGQSILEASESETYKVAKSSLDEQLDAFLRSPEDSTYICQSVVDQQIKSYDTTRLYLKMMANVFQDLLNLSVNGDITLKSYANILHELLNRLHNIDRSLLIIMTSISRLDLNVNIALLLDHVIYEITKGGK